MTPELITFAGSVDGIRHAIQAGATHVILDDPAISCRSYQDPDPRRLDTLDRLLHATEQYPNCIFSVNCDKLFHTHEFDLLDRVIARILDSPVRWMRVQDIGAMAYIAEHEPAIRIILNTEMGNANAQSMAAFSQTATRQVLGNELPVAAIKTIQKTVDTQYELMVHGPILLQYSYRRYLGSLMETERVIQGSIDDTDYPGRHFPVLDNRHGHFMFFYMDRCLLGYSSVVLGLNLSGWIVDGRGQSDAYLTTALSAYRHCLDAQTTGDAKPVQAVSPRPLKPMFFLVNNTDQERQAERDGLVLGTVIDVIKGDCIHVTLCEPFRGFQAPPRLLLPQHDRHQPYASIPPVHTLTGEPCTTAEPGDIIQLPWIKGASPKAVLVV